MINKLLITCLQRNKRLIIPTLGAFIRKSVDGVGVILVFVPFLNKDDGVLLGALQSWAGVDKEEAEVILKEYIECIRQSLDQRGQYIIESIGVLKYDANHMIYLAKEEEAVKEVVEKVVPVAVEAPAAVVMPTPVVEGSVVTPPVAAAAPKDDFIVTPTPTVEQIIETYSPRTAPQTEEPVEEFIQESEAPEVEPQKPIQSRATATATATSAQQPTYGAGNRRGTRYFSPGQSSNQEGEQHTTTPSQGGQRKSTINNLYGGGSRAAGSIYGPSQDRQQRTVGQRTAPQGVQPQQEQEYEAEQAPSYAAGKPKPQAVRRPTSSSNLGQLPKPKKKVDMVMVIAAIAVVVTILSMVYAFFFSSDATLDENIQIEQPITNAMPEVDSAAGDSTSMI